MTTFSASSETPDSPEDALKFWINKVCGLVCREGGGEGDGGQGAGVPGMEDVMRDIGDGTNIAALIAHYRPSQLDVNGDWLNSLFCLGFIFHIRRLL